MISAKIIADSLAPSGSRLTTFVLTYPRFIHSELMTHRMLSRNAASSRAIPTKKVRKAVWTNPAMPIAFSKNQPGMQASENLSGWRSKLARFLWIWSGRAMTGVAYLLEKLGVHKQHASRILEPWSHITTVASATDWDNFFALRYHPMAQPEFQELARQMWEAYSGSTPEELQAGEWHLPFVQDLYVNMRKTTGVSPLELHQLIVRSIARCARVSYLNHDGTRATLKKDLELYDRLLKASPIHASPAEHQAKAIKSRRRSGNFRGWVQYRKMLKGENVERFVPPKTRFKVK